MADPFTWIAIGTAVVGAGVGAYSSYNSGKTQQYMADLNAKAQERNARNQLMGMQTQANLMKREAEAKFALQNIEAQSRFNNAKSIENQQIGQDRIDRANARKKRDEYAAFEAANRANMAASGIVESSGVNLEMAAEFSRLAQEDMDLTHYANLMKRSTIFREAELERIGGKAALAGATLERDSALAASSMQQAAARAEYASNLRGAEITRIAGGLAGRQGTIEAGATLLNGATNAFRFGIS